MKFIKTFLLTCISALGLNAQDFQVTTQTFDLESIDRHKGWAMFSGFQNSNGNYILKIGQPWCNAMTVGSTRTYSGVGYYFEELEFDPTLNFKGKTAKSFPNTLETIPYEPVYGKRFFPQVGEFLLKRPLTPEFIGQTIVMPIIEFSGYKVASYGVYGAATANHPKFGASTCGEVLTLKQLQDQKSKENKGERWLALDHAIYPGGGVILFLTNGVVNEPDKSHFVIKQFDGDLNEKGRTILSLEYKAVVTILPVDKSNGTKDFVLIAQASNSKWLPSKETKAPNYGELIYMDGATLAIKNRQPFTMKFTYWYPENTEVDPNGNIYIYGTAGATDKTIYDGYTLPINATQNTNIKNSPKDQPNFQLLCADAQGNVKYVNAVDSKNEVAKAMLVGGVTKKAKPEVILNTYDFKKDVYFTDKYLIMAGQQFVSVSGGVDKGSLFIACFDLATGNMLKYFIKPETTYAGYNIIFNKDRSQIYWAAYDLEEHNKLDNEQGAMTSKNFKNMFGADLYLSRIDINAATATNFEQLGKEQWAVNFNSPTVVTDDNSDVIIFQGRLLAKKAKDSELVLVSVKK